MKKRLLILLCVLMGCGFGKTPDKLSPYIRAQVQLNTGVIDLSKFDVLEWDKLYIIAPYAPERSFDANLMRYKSEITGTQIGSLDDRCLLLLFNGDKMVNLSEVKRNVDFAERRFIVNGKIGSYPRKNAVFGYKKDVTGRISITRNF